MSPLPRPSAVSGTSAAEAQRPGDREINFRPPCRAKIDRLVVGDIRRAGEADAPVRQPSRGRVRGRPRQAESAADLLLEFMDQRLVGRR